MIDRTDTVKESRKGGPSGEEEKEGVSLFKIAEESTTSQNRGHKIGSTLPTLQKP